MKIYQDTIIKVEELLEQNTEWRDRYKGYVENIGELSEKFNEAQKQFMVPVPFQLYMPISTAVNECSCKRTVFELRFHGQSVAKLYVDNCTEKTVSLEVKSTPAIYKAIRTTDQASDAKYLKNLAKMGRLDWHSTEAKEFRRIFADLEQELTAQGSVQLSGQPEHDMESLLLQNYAQKSSEGKEICYIQPVTMQNTRARFQMPTPIRASDVKKGIDTLTYSGKSGGGIDILTRIGNGRNTTLTVMELKDENTDSESPDRAICQAIAYATFLRKLIRSESGQDWWNFFGFGGTVPKNLIIKAMVVMPLKNKKGFVSELTENFINYIDIPENKILDMPGLNDQIELGYIFRDSVTPKKSF